MGKKVVKLGCLIGFLRLMILTEKMQMNNIIGKFVADNIAFGMEVLAYHPEELSLEIWEFTDFHQVS